MSNLQANARRQSNSERGVGGSQLSSRTGSRGGRRRQSFETTIKDTIAGYTEFQRQSLQQLRQVLLTKMITMNGKRQKHIPCSKAGSIDEDKLQMLEAMTGVSRNNQDVPKQLGKSTRMGVHIQEGYHLEVHLCRNSLGGQSSGGLWAPSFQQWGTPPNAQQWGSPQPAPQWGTPPNAPQWGTPPNAPQWGTPQMLNSGVHHQTLNNGGFLQTFSHLLHHQTFISLRLKIFNKASHQDNSNNCSIWIFTWG
ncbi:unnamed protein product [Microthlaspi erraticum]|uniref:Uncharacterized protein n=1 Tax=Microthlaspi erraticum TaxID=1685480 RepID=A0A6D2I6R1_9BRAS|nr:unnamed protein product [Microthlaspi erraticum]